MTWAALYKLQAPIVRACGSHNPNPFTHCSHEPQFLSCTLLNLLPPTSSPRFQLPTLPPSQVPNSIARSNLGCIAVLIRAAMPPQYRRPPSRHRGTGGDSVSNPHSAIRLWGADGHLGRPTLAFRRHGTTNGRARHLIDPGLRRGFTPLPPWDAPSMGMRVESPTARLTKAAGPRWPSLPP